MSKRGALDVSAIAQKTGASEKRVQKLADMTIVELRALASEKGVVLGKLTKKSDIVEALAASRKRRSSAKASPKKPRKASGSPKKARKATTSEKKPVRTSASSTGSKRTRSSGKAGTLKKLEHVDPTGKSVATLSEDVDAFTLVVLKEYATKYGLKFASGARKQAYVARIAQHIKQAESPAKRSPSVSSLASPRVSPMPKPKQHKSKKPKAPAPAPRSASPKPKSPTPPPPASPKKKHKSKKPKSPARKSPARRSASPARRSASPARKSPARKSPARKSPARKSPARKSPARKSPARRSASSKKRSGKKHSSGRAAVDGLVQEDIDGKTFLGTRETIDALKKKLTGKVGAVRMEGLNSKGLGFDLTLGIVTGAMKQERKRAAEACFKPIVPK